jgi:hypothetical protein
MNGLVQIYRILFTVDTERRGRVVNTLALYSGGPRFKSGTGDRLSCVRFFVAFLNASQAHAGIFPLNQATTASF